MPTNISLLDPTIFSCRLLQLACAGIREVFEETGVLTSESCITPLGLWEVGYVMRTRRDCSKSKPCCRKLGAGGGGMLVGRW